MDKINMINYQRLVLQTKFGKRNEKKQNRFLVIIFLLSIFFSLLFLNTDAQALINHCCSLDCLGITNIGGNLSHG
jgi:hypothetical protein